MYSAICTLNVYIRQLYLSLEKIDMLETIHIVKNEISTPSIKWKDSYGSWPSVAVRNS